jgi:hypothetical protein
MASAMEHEDLRSQCGCDGIKERVRNRLTVSASVFALTNRPQIVSVRDFSNRGGVCPPVRSDDSRQLPSVIFGIVDGIDAP